MIVATIRRIPSDQCAHRARTVKRHAVRRRCQSLCVSLLTDLREGLLRGTGNQYHVCISLYLPAMWELSVVCHRQNNKAGCDAQLAPDNVTVLSRP